MSNETPADRHHSIDYVELTVPDLPRAKAFYSRVFGWSFTDYGPEYAGIQGPDREPGGLAQGESRGSGGALVVLYSTDLEATRTAVLEAGGTLVKEPFDFPGGRRFHFADPGGNELAVWTTTG